MCINMDTTVLSEAAVLLSGLFPGIEEARQKLSKEEEIGACPGGHIEEIADELIERILGGREAAGMNREEKVLAIRFMEQKGLFLIKGVVDKVAARMGISKVTVYSYLDEIRDGGEA